MIAGVLGAAIGWGMRAKHLHPADPVGGAAGASSAVESSHAVSGVSTEPEPPARSVRVRPELRGTSFAHHAPAG
jgi:hypothetical protein